MSNEITIARIVEYTDIFPEESGHEPDIVSLVSGINRKHLVTLTANMMSRLSGKKFYDADLIPTADNVDFIRFFISWRNREFIQDIVRRFRFLEKRNLAEGHDEPLLATRPAAIMYFQKIFFSVPPCEDEFTPEMEVRFFKAMLLANQKVNSGDHTVDDNLPLDLQVAETFLAYNFANEGIEPSDTHDAYRRQMVRFVELVTFLERHKRLKPLRELFRQHYRIGHIYHYLAPHVIVIHRNKIGAGLHVFKGGNKIAKVCKRIMGRSAIRYDDVIPMDKNADFLTFRAFPVIQVGKHDFAVTSTAFMLDHIYESMYFQLKAFRLFAGFKNDDEFRTYITTMFTQDWMLNRFMARCVTNDVKALTEERSKEMVGRKKGLEPPDYYVNENGKIILFELKDTLAKAQTKESRDADEFFADLKERFYESKKGARKAIRQLIDNVKSIQKGSFVFDNIPSTSIVYPVLVVDSTYFTQRGVHTKLEYWMRDYCKMIGVDDTKVKPIVLMDISTLRLYCRTIKEKGFVYHFEQYYKNIDWRKNPTLPILLNAQKSFSEYMAENPVEDINAVCNQVMRACERSWNK